MDVLELIRRRRSQRVEFLDKPIEEADIAALVEAARWAPSPFNVQPWELLFVVDGEQKEGIARLTRGCIVEQFRDAEFLQQAASWTRVTEEEWERRGDGVLLGDQLPESGFAAAVAPFLLRHARTASLLGKLGAGNAPGRATERLLAESPLLCVVFRNHGRRSPGEGGETWTLLAIGAMVQNLLLAATERNIGAQFVNAALERPEDRESVRLLLAAPQTYEPLVILRLGYLGPGERRSVRLPPERFVGYDQYGGDEP
jgi:nitroreductase